MKLRRILLVLLGVTGLVSCEKKDDSKLVLAYQDRIVDTLSILAMARGTGMENIEGRIFSSGPQTVEALMSGSADVATVGDSAAITLLSRSDDYVIIASHGKGPGRHRIIVHNGVVVKSWNDLKGLKIGMKLGTSTHGGFLLKSREEGLTGDLNIIDMSPSLQLTALASGEIDVMIASEPTPSQAEAKGIGYDFATLETGNMTYPVVLMTNRKTLETKKGLLKQLLARMSGASDFLETDREKALSILGEITGMDKTIVSESVARHSFNVGNPSEIRDSMTGLTEVLHETGYVSGTIDWDKALNDSLF